MVTFTTLLSFISYNFVIIGLSFLLFKSIEYIVESTNDKKIKNDKKDKLIIGGVYGGCKIGDTNNPFEPLRNYQYYIAILDSKPSRDGECYYYQYCYLNDDMKPYKYSTTYSHKSDWFEDFDYICNIDLDTINLS